MIMKYLVVWGVVHSYLTGKMKKANTFGKEDLTRVNKNHAPQHSDMLMKTM